jgi:hypothetical protein
MVTFKSARVLWNSRAWLPVWWSIIKPALCKALRQSLAFTTGRAGDIDLGYRETASLSVLGSASLGIGSPCLMALSR